MADNCVLYYTCLSHDITIELACRKQLLIASGGIKVIAVSLNNEIDFGNERIVLHGERGPLMMHKQILAGLECIDGGYVFLCESDMLYHPSHFEFTPPRDDTFCYNSHVWKVRYSDGHAVWTDDLHQVSGICAAHSILLDFYRKRVAQIEQDGFNRHYEPGHKQTVGAQRVDSWMSEFPNIDIRHDKTITRSRWSPDAFRNKKYAKGWKEASSIEGWGRTEGRMKEFLEGV